MNQRKRENRRERMCRTRGSLSGPLVYEVDTQSMVFLNNYLLRTTICFFAVLLMVIGLVFKCLASQALIILSLRTEFVSKLAVEKSNRKAMNRNWSNQKANPALKTKTGNKQEISLKDKCRRFVFFSLQLFLKNNEK